MILHFLKQDLRNDQNKWLWLMVLFIGSLYLANTDKSLVILPWVILWIFPMTKIAHIFGVKFRTQQVMSRNYLLSLPINRKEMFLINSIRIGVYLLPLFVFLWGSYFLNAKIPYFGKIVHPINMLISISLVALFFLLSTVTSNLDGETIRSHHIEPNKRLAKFLISYGINLIKLVPIAFALMLSDESSALFVLGPVIALAFTALEYRLAERKWIGV